MMYAKVVPTKDLFQALIRAKRAFRGDDLESPPENLASPPEELAPLTLRDGVSCECD